MTAEPARQPRGRRVRTLLTRLFQAFIVLCLIDGFVDIAYPALGAAKAYVARQFSDPRPSGPIEPGSIHDVVWPLPNLTLRGEPGIAGIVAEHRSAGTTVDADGRRSNGLPPPEKPEAVGLVLGSSAAFGFGIADDQTLSAHLERALGTVRVDNYAGLLQPLADTTLRWWDLQRRNGKPDFVIIAGASLDLYTACVPPLPVSATRNALLFLAERLTVKASSPKDMPCLSQHSMELAVRHAIHVVQNAVSVGRQQGVPFYIVLLPTPYDAGVNVENLRDNPHFKAAVDRLRPAYRRYHEELAKIDLPEFIDLSQVLPPEKMYLIDAGAHLSGEGNALIAARLAERLRSDRASGLLPASLSAR